MERKFTFDGTYYVQPNDNLDTMCEAIGESISRQTENIEGHITWYFDTFADTGEGADPCVHKRSEFGNDLCLADGTRAYSFDICGTMTVSHDRMVDEEGDYTEEFLALFKPLYKAGNEPVAFRHIDDEDDNPLLG